MTSQAKAGAATQTQAIRATLQAERSASAGTRNDLEAQLHALRSATIASNSDDEHDPEGSTVAFEAAQLESLRERAAEHLADIDRAMQRLGSGTYGVCVRCERRIGAARLAALPAAECCVQCAGRRR